MMQAHKIGAKNGLSSSKNKNVITAKAIRNDRRSSCSIFTMLCPSGKNIVKAQFTARNINTGATEVEHVADQIVVNLR